MRELLRQWVGAAQVGRGGEEEAQRLLKGKGYRILACNWRNPRDEREELDLVCLDRETLVFVEVKTRKTGGPVRGLESLNGRKLRVLRRACQAYLRGLPEATRPAHYRLDVVEVCHGPSPGPEGPLLHFENYPLFRGRFA